MNWPTRRNGSGPQGFGAFVFAEKAARVALLTDGRSTTGG